MNYRFVSVAPPLQRSGSVDPRGDIAASSAGAVTAADELFVNLDRSIVSTDDACWQIEVCGIHEIQDQWWLQLNLIGRERHMVTVRTDTASVASIREQLADWLSHAPVAVPVHGTTA